MYKTQLFYDSVWYRCFEFRFLNNRHKVKKLHYSVHKKFKETFRISTKLSGAHFFLSASVSSRLQKNCARARAAVKIFFWGRAQAILLSSLKLCFHGLLSATHCVWVRSYERKLAFMISIKISTKILWKSNYLWAQQI